MVFDAIDEGADGLKTPVVLQHLFDLVKSRWMLCTPYIERKTELVRHFFVMSTSLVIGVLESSQVTVQDVVHKLLDVQGNLFVIVDDALELLGS